MQFMIKAMDYQDAGALARRLEAREAHLKVTQAMKDSGHYQVAAALLDEQGQMNGSVIICDFESEEALKRHIAQDPYIAFKVWEKIEIIPCKIGPMFL